MSEDRLTDALQRLVGDVGRIASSLEALVHRAAVNDGAPRIVCLHPRPSADPLAPVNLATGPDTLFINLQLIGGEPATVGPITVIAGDARADAEIHQGSARVQTAQVSGGGFMVGELVVVDDLRSRVTATPQQDLELRVRLTPGAYSGGTVAVIPLRPAGGMSSRPGWLPHDAYDVPAASLTD